MIKNSQTIISSRNVNNAVPKVKGTKLNSFKMCKGWLVRKHRVVESRFVNN